jgi:hypothetical protein
MYPNPATTALIALSLLFLDHPRGSQWCLRIDMNTRRIDSLPSPPLRKSCDTLLAPGKSFAGVPCGLLSDQSLHRSVGVLEGQQGHGLCEGLSWQLLGCHFEDAHIALSVFPKIVACFHRVFCFVYETRS